MNRDDLKAKIAELLDKGESLAEIQKILDREYDEKMTFLDLRLIASEIESVDWTKGEEEDEPPADEKQDKKEEPSTGTVVEVSRVARPGVMMSGSVKFASGATADWVLDQMGRLGLENSVGEPTEDDIQEFQMELQRKVAGG